jgi:hypothetical protein
MAGQSRCQVIDKIRNRKQSGFLCFFTCLHFSLSNLEIAKANRLKPYEYVAYLLIEIPKHMDDKNQDFFKDLLP